MSDWLDAADDAEVDRIMRLSHADLVAEAKERGEDPAATVEWVNRVIQEAKRAAYEEAKRREWLRECQGD